MISSTQETQLKIQSLEILVELLVNLHKYSDDLLTYKRNKIYKISEEEDNVAINLKSIHEIKEEKRKFQKLIKKFN